MILFLCYPRCSTCMKAKKQLQEHNIAFTERNIALQRPTVEELRQWISLSSLPIKKFFNTSGNLYKQLNLKEKLPKMSEEEQLELLASDGMLVKRPLLIERNRVLVGYKQEEVESLA